MSSRPTFRLADSSLLRITDGIAVGWVGAQFYPAALAQVVIADRDALRRVARFKGTAIGSLIRVTDLEAGRRSQNHNI